MLERRVGRCSRDYVHYKTLTLLIGSLTEKAEESIASPSTEDSARSESIGDEEEIVEERSITSSLKDEGSDDGQPAPEEPIDEPPKETEIAIEKEEDTWANFIPPTKPKKKGKVGWTFE